MAKIASPVDENTTSDNVQRIILTNTDLKPMNAIPNRGVAVSPNDSTDLAIPGSLFVGTAGTVSVIFEGDSTNTAVAMTSQDSQYHPIKVKRVLLNGTSATGIVVLYNV